MVKIDKIRDTISKLKSLKLINLDHLLSRRYLKTTRAYQKLLIYPHMISKIYLFLVSLFLQQLFQLIQEAGWLFFFTVAISVTLAIISITAIAISMGLDINAIHNDIALL